MSESDPFSRWAARRRAVAAEEAAAQEAAAPKPPEPETISEEEEDEAAILARLGLPDPDTLVSGDDFSVFMQAGVPEFLRRRALRRLWRSNPVLANLDGLNDYDDDYTSPELTKKVLATAYKVGRGFLRDDVETPAPATETPAGPEPAPEPAPDAPAEMAVTDDDAPPASETGQPLAESDTPEEPTFRPRRMSFRT